MQNNGKKKIGLVLTGGGARAAYQAGVLNAIAEITGFEEIPFSIISGYSAGALNGAWLASRNDNFKTMTSQLVEAWASISAEDIFNVGAISFSRIAYRWLRDRTTGALSDRRQITYLLDTSPLAKYIENKIDFKALNQNVENSKFHAVSISATDYRTGHSVAFYNGHRDITDWERLNRKSIRTEISAEHILASSAIPIFFPPVKIAQSYFGDGMVRLNTPLSSAVRLGAEKLLIIGSRGPSSTSNTAAAGGITLGEIVGTILNGLFFDSLDGDIARLRRINRAVAALNQDERASQPDRLREIPFLNLNPSHDVAQVPSCQLSRMPMTLNYLLKGIGVSKGKGSDLLSYLAFEPAYLRSLIQAGHEDTMASSDKVLEFFRV